MGRVEWISELLWAPWHWKPKRSNDCSACSKVALLVFNQRCAPNFCIHGVDVKCTIIKSPANARLWFLIKFEGLVWIDVRLFPVTRRFFACVLLWLIPTPLFIIHCNSFSFFFVQFFSSYFVDLCDLLYLQNNSSTPWKQGNEAFHTESYRHISQIVLYSCWVSGGFSQRKRRSCRWISTCFVVLWLFVLALLFFHVFLQA